MSKFKKGDYIQNKYGIYKIIDDNVTFGIYPDAYASYHIEIVRNFSDYAIPIGMYPSKDVAHSKFKLLRSYGSSLWKAMNDEL